MIKQMKSIRNWQSEIKPLKQKEQIKTHRGNLRSDENERMIRASLPFKTSQYIKEECFGDGRKFDSFGIATPSYQDFCNLVDSIKSQLEANA